MAEGLLSRSEPLDFVGDDDTFKHRLQGRASAQGKRLPNTMEEAGVSAQQSQPQQPAASIVVQPHTILVDGSNLLHRILHVPLKNLETAYGEETGGVYGTLMSIRSVMERFPSAKRVVVVWDGGKSARRMQLLLDYKIRKADPTESLHREFYDRARAQLFEILPALGVHQVFMQAEADDLIAALCFHLSESQTPVLVVTDDKDMLQLVTKSCWVWRPSKERLVTVENMIDAFGVPVGLIPLYISLIGDASDGISGVTGVGEKTALAVLNVAAVAAQSIGLDPNVLPAVYDDWIPAIQTAIDSLDHASGLHKRAQKVLAGIDTIIRNIALIDLRFERLDGAAIDAFLSADTTRFNDRAFLAVAGRMEFASIIKSWSAWMQPFTRLA